MILLTGGCSRQLTAVDDPDSQVLYELGSESNNPRAYDPANGGADRLVFSGLVMLNPQLQVVPDLAESWDVDPSGTVYTFHLRPNARFHNGRPVTAADVIYSWERAAAPATHSDTALTYLGDIVGAREESAGHAAHMRGLAAVDDHTLRVTIDAPKPYFLMKLVFSTAMIVDRANVVGRADWYRQPNGTGPYRLVSWDSGKQIVYQRNEAFYLPRRSSAPSTSSSMPAWARACTKAINSTSPA